MEILTAAKLSRAPRRVNRFWKRRSVLKIIVCWVLVVANSETRQTARGDDTVIDTFDKKQVDRTKWRFPRAPIFNKPGMKSNDATSRYLRLGNGELTFFVPPNDAKREQFMIVSKFGLENNFNVRVDYRIDGGIPAPAESGFSNFEVMVSGEGGNANFARSLHGKHKQGYSLFFRPSESRETELRTTMLEKQREEAAERGGETTSAERTDLRDFRFSPTTATEGRLELERRGDLLFAFSEGKRVGTAPIGPGSIQQINIGVVVQGPTTDAFTVSVLNVEIESNVSATEPSYAPPTPPQDIVADSSPAEPTAERSGTFYFWLPWVLCFFAIATIVLLLLVKRGSGSSSASPAKPAKPTKVRKSGEGSRTRKRKRPRQPDIEPQADNIDDFNVS